MGNANNMIEGTISKLCKVCNSLKSIDLFYKKRDTKDKLHWRCIACEKADYKKRYENSPGFRDRAIKRAKAYWKLDKGKEANTKAVLKYKFNLSLQIYNQLIDLHENKCAICRQEETIKHKGIVKRLAVDHCHATGKVRGLLCQACNTAIGKFKDGKNLLLRAIDYIEKEGNIL